MLCLTTRAQPVSDITILASIEKTGRGIIINRTSKTLKAVETFLCSIFWSYSGLQLLFKTVESLCHIIIPLPWGDINLSALKLKMNTSACFHTRSVDVNYMSITIKILSHKQITNEDKPHHLKSQLLQSLNKIINIKGKTQYVVHYYLINIHHFAICSLH